MASISDILVGLEVAGEVNGMDSDVGGAEHDTFFLLPPHTKLSNEQQKQLTDAGWRYSEENGWYHFV